MAFARLRHPRSRRGRSVLAAFVTLIVGGATIMGTAGSAQAADDVILGFIVAPKLDGSGNNQFNPTWGQANRPYLRVAAPRYADGRSAPVSGPNSRFVSNRVHNDVAQNLFSERRVSQWGFVWGQFLDHTFGLRDAAGESSNIPFSSTDPIEEFTNNLGVIPFTRSKASPNTGVFNARQQTNTENSYIDAETVYGTTLSRLEWLRDGPCCGDMSNNDSSLMMPGGYLPRRDARGNASTAPVMDVDGRLLANPASAAVAGDVRANENLALTATQTLWAREHNRLRNHLLQFNLTAEERFQLARRFVMAEQQYITYNEFLPAMGVNLPPYAGYNPNVNATLSNEFATVGYRAHSQIHGELEVETDLDRYSQADLDFFEAQGIEVEIVGDEVALVIPLNVAFFNPELLKRVQLGPMLQGIGLEPEYKNDEQIDNQLRSTLFQIPVPGNPGCLDGPTLPECFKGVVDLGAIDIERGRDHGMPSYNQLRAAYGLPTKSSFRAITGEATELFPADPQLTPGNEINDPDSLDFTALFDGDGNSIPLGSEAADSEAVRGVRRTTLAARLRAIYGSVGNVDAFVGMVSEPHVPGSEFGELQLAIWKKQFAALRDGDRFFYQDNPSVELAESLFNVNIRKTLARVIALNTDIPESELAANVFLAAGDGLAATSATGADAASSTASVSFSETARGAGTSPDRVPTGAAAVAAVALTSAQRQAGTRRRRGRLPDRR